MRFRGQSAIVTGASRGIGRATALALARQGASVVVNYRSRAEEAAAVVGEIEELGGRSVAIQADVSDPAEASALIDRGRRELGGLHILINNAGVSHDGLTANLDVDAVWRVMEVNFGGVLHCTRAAAPMLMTQRQGSIVNISSVIGERGWMGASGYAASKAAINAFTLCGAVELARFGVRVNAVLAGFTRTDLITKLLDKEKGALRRQVPLRDFASAEQIAEVVAFVASPDAAYVTGALIRADGGFGAQLGAGRIGG